MLSLRARLEEVRKKELEKAAEEKKKKEIETLKREKFAKEQLDRLLKLEKIAKENFLPILDDVKDYFKDGVIFFNSKDENLERILLSEEIESKIIIQWNFRNKCSDDYEDSNVYRVWDEFSIGVKQDLTFKLYNIDSKCFFNSTLNDKNWKNKLEDAIFSLLTGTIPTSSS